MQPTIAKCMQLRPGIPGRRLTGYVVALLAAGAMLTPTLAWGAGDEVLQKVVIVSRHGVRTPEVSAAELDGWSTGPWPAWNEPAGDLTARGAQLAKLLGQYYRSYAISEQLLPEQGCPPRGSVLFYADVAERTKATAQALLDGLAPGCGIAYGSKQGATVDGLFHPVVAGVCRRDAKAAPTPIH
jgi:4-phytase/acid phosphatase